MFYTELAAARRPERCRRRYIIAWASCSRSNGARALDAFALTRRVHRLPDVASALHVEPEVGTVAEHAGKDESRWGCHSPAVVAQFVDVLALHTHGLCQRALGKTHRLHEFLSQNFSDSRRLALRHQHGTPQR